MTSESANQSSETQEQWKIIENYQTCRKIRSVKPEKQSDIARPFRRGEPRLNTFTKQWKKNVDLTTLNREKQLAILRSKGKNDPFYRGMVAQKIRGYLDQDHKKKFGEFGDLSAVDNTPIGVDEVVDLMVGCGLQCYYCAEETLFIYETVRDPKQWTLERLDNEKPHCLGNVVVACLACNLRRRCIHYERYLKSKQIVAVEKLDSLSELESGFDAALEAHTLASR